MGLLVIEYHIMWLVVHPLPSVELFPYLTLYSLHQMASSRPLWSTLFRVSKSMSELRKFVDPSGRQKMLHDSEVS